MNILVIGSGEVANALIGKLGKNGHKVYLLTLKKNNRFNSTHIVEKYNLNYESENVKNILDSVRPEITIFLGAFDANYTWHRSETDMATYIGGLTNILAVFSLMNYGKFIYLSSQEVYDETYAEKIKEDQEPSPKGFRALALAQGERLCQYYRQMQGTDTLILRLDNVYWVPTQGNIQNNPCFQLCFTALQEGKILANRRKIFSLLYLNDAIEQIYHLISSKNLRNSCYHITSGEEINEFQLAQLIKDDMKSGIEILENTTPQEKRLVLDGQRFEEEFGREIFNSLDKGVPQVADFMKYHSELFLEEDEDNFNLKLIDFLKKHFKRIIPYLENILVFLFIFFLNYWASGEGQEFIGKLDLYLLYVLIFAVIYGQKQAIISAFLAMLGYIFASFDKFRVFESLVDYTTYLWIAQLFIVGLTVGYLRDRLKFVQRENHTQQLYLEDQLKSLEEINDSNVRMKHYFESQIVNQKDSLGKIYEISSALERYDPEEVLFYAAEVLSQVMDCPDVAIYAVENENYARLFSSTSPESRKLGNSIKYTDLKEIYADLEERRVYINRNMDKKLPMMASGVYSETGTKLILMLWKLPWERMTLGEANRLTILGSLIQNAVLHATRYLEALHDQRYIEETSILEESAFFPLIRAFSEAQKKGLTQYSLLRINTNGESPKEVEKTLEKKIRHSDYFGFYNNELYVLLSNTSADQAQVIIERFKREGYTSSIEEVKL